jgi:hypothetical protein
MKKNILFCTILFLMFSNAFAQRIVNSAIGQYSNFRNTLYYNSLYDEIFDRTFELSDGSIVTISNNQYSYYVTKWNKELAVLDKTEIEQTKKQIVYHSYILNDVIYLFSCDLVKDDQYAYYYYEISCKEKLSIAIKNNSINARVIWHDTTYIYMLPEDNSGIQRVDMNTLQTEKVIVPVQNLALRNSTCYADKGYVIFMYEAVNAAKSKTTDNSIETYVLETRTWKINKLSADFIVDKINVEELDVAVNRDSIYFMTYSNASDHLLLEYKVLAYDFSSNKTFLEKKSSLTLTKYYHRDLATVFFEVDPNTGNLILILDRYHTVINPTAGVKSSARPIFSAAVPLGGSGYSAFFELKEEFYKYVQIDYPVIYFNTTGDVLNVSYVYWPKTEMSDRLTESFFPGVLVVDGLVHVFVANPAMDGMTCYVYNTNGTLKDKIILFENDKADKNIVCSSSIFNLSSGEFVFATVPPSIGKTGNYYKFNVYK